MRVDHAGEVCAQALYLSQSVFARSPETRSLMSRSASEEEAHLRLTKTRLDELGARTSALNPLWFAGSLAVGALAAMIGDRFSLGFLAETEVQVAQHLDGHLRQLAPEDRDSRLVLRQMRADELAHASLAAGEGGIEFPLPARIAMRATAKVMTTMAARI
jgi:ubiquinone biosynthesis monooxygenase Coq7